MLFSQPAHALKETADEKSQQNHLWTKNNHPTTLEQYLLNQISHFFCHLYSVGMQILAQD
jgi:hypothetical protein